MTDSIECNSHEASNQDNQQFRLNKINESKTILLRRLKKEN